MLLINNTRYVLPLTMFKRMVHIIRQTHLLHGLLPAGDLLRGYGGEGLIQLRNVTGPEPNNKFVIVDLQRTINRILISASAVPSSSLLYWKHFTVC